MSDNISDYIYDYDNIYTFLNIEKFMRNTIIKKNIKWLPLFSNSIGIYKNKKPQYKYCRISTNRWDFKLGKKENSKKIIYYCQTVLKQ